MNSHIAMTRNDESGFTLVELLVVIAIIAILTAIAVPSFLSQRAKANDAAIRSDMKSVVTTIETALIDNSGDVSVETDAGVAEVIVGTATSNVKLSKGVTVSSTEDSTAARYVLNGTHEGREASIQYDSANGGFIAESGEAAPSTPPAGLPEPTIETVTDHEMSADEIALRALLRENVMVWANHINSVNDEYTGVINKYYKESSPGGVVTEIGVVTEPRDDADYIRWPLAGWSKPAEISTLNIGYPSRTDNFTIDVTGTKRSGASTTKVSLLYDSTTNSFSTIYYVIY